MAIGIRGAGGTDQLGVTKWLYKYSPRHDRVTSQPESPQSRLWKSLHPGGYSLKLVCGGISKGVNMQLLTIEINTVYIAVVIKTNSHNQLHARIRLIRDISFYMKCKK